MIDRIANARKLNSNSEVTTLRRYRNVCIIIIIIINRTSNFRTTLPPTQLASGTAGGSVELSVTLM